MDMLSDQDLPQRQVEAEPAQVVTMQPPKGLNRRLLISALVSLVVLASIVAVFLWWTGHTKPAVRHTSQTSSSGQSSNQVAPDTATTNTATTYVSNGKDLKLSFTYPSSWTVTPPSGGNTDDQTITLTSPLTSMSDANDQSVTSKAVVTIRPNGADFTELASEKATAGQASAQIAYAHPTAAQHQYPYLTYIHLAGGNNPSSVFEEVIITGITSFAKDQSILPISLGQLDPIVSATFYTCATHACSGSDATLLSLTNSTWQSSDLGMQVLAMFQSLQLN